MSGSLQELTSSAARPFNIIEDYMALSPGRKILLCGHDFIEDGAAFARMVRLIWPAAAAQDIKKLGNFLVLLKATLH